EDAIDARAPGQVPVVQRAEVPVEELRPALECGRELAADPERQVDIRPLLLRTRRDGAGDRGAHDPGVRVGERQQPPPDLLPLLGREHLVPLPVMPPRFWVAGTKRCKDAGSAHIRRYGRDRGRGSAPRASGPEAGMYCWKGHYVWPRRR